MPVSVEKEEEEEEKKAIRKEEFVWEVGCILASSLGPLNPVAMETPEGASGDSDALQNPLKWKRSQAQRGARAEGRSPGETAWTKAPGCGRRGAGGGQAGRRQSCRGGLPLHQAPNQGALAPQGKGQAGLCLEGACPPLLGRRGAV